MMESGLWLGVPPKMTASSRQRCGLSRYILGSASHCQSSLCLKTAKKCLHNRPVRLKSGQLHLGIQVFPTKDKLYHVSLESSDLT